MERAERKGKRREKMTTAAATPDAAPRNWVDRFAPSFAKPYLRLMRADRPIGTWLLFIPCLWGLALARLETDQAGSAATVALFALGAFVMRGAGCAYNDIVDRDFDARVARTALRPIPSGQISVRNAWAFLVFLSLIGLAVLLQFNRLTIFLGVGSLALVATYPFMKRVTWWPQAFLGLTFNWGVLIGSAAASGAVSPSALCLYAAGVFWTLGYDTIYAHQDKDDDALIGVKSSALRLGSRTKPALALLYALTITFFGAAGALAGAHIFYFAALVPAAAHFLWQIRRLDIDDAALCLKLFKSNRDAGLLLLAALLSTRLFPGA
jgi:4-hydroxybenzoate polyprenyltransferase